MLVELINGPDVRSTKRYQNIRRRRESAQQFNLYVKTTLAAFL
jgi:hypothetical protein